MPCGKSAGAQPTPRISLGSSRFCERVLILGINFRESVRVVGAQLKIKNQKLKIPRVSELLEHNQKSKIKNQKSKIH